MREYSYKDIKKIAEWGILFQDGFQILFEECRNEWLIEKKLEKDESYCIAERNSLAKNPYFLFYSKYRVKVFFDKRGFFCKRRNEAEYQKLQIILNRYGYTSYDMT